MPKAETLNNLVNSPLHRRDFAKKIAAGAMAVAGVAALPGSVEMFAQSLTDVDILNFALNLEYLEAEFYTVATTGQRIADVGIGVTGKGRGGATTGGAKVSLDDFTAFTAMQITIDEQAHVNLLRAALKGDAVAKPDINLEALGVGFRSQAEFLTVATIFEDVGVSAYGGAAPLIDSPQILGVAARIALTEGQHAGVLRSIVSRAALAIPQVDPKAIPTIGNLNGRLFFVDGNGLSVSRTTSEVLKIVYAGGTSSGGFFPSGVNGTIARA
ncbi:MAG: ferritin-like domain-containing protein [Acidobacteriota bacterium]